MAVTDLAVTNGGLRSRVLTVSLDQTCKMLCLATGRTLLDLQVGERLHSVCLAAGENAVVCGSEEGSVYVFPLVSAPKGGAVQVTRTEENCAKMRLAHKGAVRCVYKIIL